MRPVEVKDVGELLPAHVRPAKDHMGINAGRPIVTVPTRAIVREELTEGVDILKIRKRRER